MRLFDSFRLRLTLNDIVARADVLYLRSQINTNLIPLTADYYLVAAVYCSLFSPSQQVQEYVSRLEERVFPNYNPFHHYANLSNFAHQPLSPVSDYHRLQKAMLFFEDRFSFFCFSDFAKEYISFGVQNRKIVLEFPKR